MIAERDDPFLDLGYTSPELAEKLRAARIGKTGKDVVRRTTKAPSTRRHRPPVGEDEVLLNVDMESTPLDPQQATHQVDGVWADREANIVAGLEADLENRDSDNPRKKAMARKTLDTRQKRWDDMGRPPLQLMMPGMNLSNLRQPDKSSEQ